jgi:hypothetical protein
MSKKLSAGERIKLRAAILNQAYEQYFDSGGKESRFIVSQEETEKLLALLYLAEKGLINCQPIKGLSEFMIKITVEGIDFIEDLLCRGHQA